MSSAENFTQSAKGKIMFCYKSLIRSSAECDTAFSITRWSLTR